jgi:hypothetical protein
MIDRGKAAWEGETRRLLTAMFGIETVGVGLDDIIDRGHRQRKTPEEVALEIGRIHNLATLDAWKHRDDPAEGE